jgi:hypothetical protein
MEIPGSQEIFGHTAFALLFSGVIHQFWQGWSSDHGRIPKKSGRVRDFG